METETDIDIPERDSRGGEPKYLPSLEEIAEECRLIREGWSEAERAKRWTLPGRVPVEPGRVFRVGE